VVEKRERQAGGVRVCVPLGFMMKQTKHTSFLSFFANINSLCSLSSFFISASSRMEV
jgi:hypothetical protein